jgi:hypothetical protein
MVAECDILAVSTLFQHWHISLRWSDGEGSQLAYSARNLASFRLGYVPKMMNRLPCADGMRDVWNLKQEAACLPAGPDRRGVSC